MNEELKTVQEVAKTTGKVVDATAKLGSFFSKVLGAGIRELGEAFHDWTRFYRYKNLINIQDKVNAIHKQRQIEGKTIPIPPRYAIPLIQSASQEDSESLQNMWAGLIANATDPNKRFQYQKIYIQILSDLEPLDALLLDYLFDQEDIINIDDEKVPKINAEYLSDIIKQDRETINISLSNLFRLGCLIDSWKGTWDSMATGYQGFRVNNPESNFRLSQLGRRLMDSCKTT